MAGLVMDGDWRADLDAWLEPLLAGLGHKAQRSMCLAYIAGLTGPGDRKSIQPMAARTSDIPYDRLHHFVSAGAWDSAPLEAALWRHADHLVGGPRSFLIVDDTALPKKGSASVGVAPQYASFLGKNANCQTLVSLTLAAHEVPVMLGLRLFPPDAWIADPTRMSRARVPEEHQTARSSLIGSSGRHADSARTVAGRSRYTINRICQISASVEVMTTQMRLCRKFELSCI